MNSRVVMAEQSSHVNISLHSKLGDEEEEEQATMVKQSGDEGALVKADGGDEGGAGGGDDDDDDEDEEDLVDPMDTLRDSCKAQANCNALSEKLDACSSRVESRSKNTEECIEEMLDLIHCVDDCVSHNIHHHWK
ncbi:cytochrome b-c1 complex subunit 6, mitochondrial-like [Convolutriloba macropyga]|uniref:cytochrome b-c1 complex subunit 6, mitochondrial-like n=1 Tax=Convolutriloba macropyga TaxID=536237 RepID=UPI003F5284C1